MQNCALVKTSEACKRWTLLYTSSGQNTKPFLRWHCLSLPDTVHQFVNFIDKATFSYANLIMTGSFLPPFRRLLPVGQQWCSLPQQSQPQSLIYFRRLNVQNLSLKGMSLISLVRIVFSNSLLTLEHRGLESANLQRLCFYSLHHSRKSQGRHDVWERYLIMALEHLPSFISKQLSKDHSWCSSFLIWFLQS